MSRIGKIPVKVPANVKGSVNAGLVVVEGPKGKLEFRPGNGVEVVLKDNAFIVTASGSGQSNSAADYGTARATINNMVKGVTDGWKRSLELNGVGFNAKLQGQNLVLAVGFSHEVTLAVPETVKCVVTKNTIDIECPNRQIMGNFASMIRKVQPPEPYLGKGIKYSDEKVRRKAGKTGKKG